MQLIIKILLFIISTNSLANISVVADNAIIDYKNNTIEYSENVQFISKDMKITADKLTIKVLNKEKRHYKVIATGKQNPVFFKRKNNNTIIDSSANTVIYNTKNQLLHLVNNAKISQNNHNFSGDRIIYNIKKDIIDMQGQDDNKVKISIDL